ncbi:MAG: agmatine/peptidylarginine deiminase [Candidatus Korobacteraceae bacterium]
MKPQSSSSSKTPAQLGFRMPAEWEPHDATWIAWPHNRSDWPGKFAAIPWVYADIVRNLSHAERVEILIEDEAAEESVSRILERSGARMAEVRFHRWPTNRVWTRDYGPAFVVKPGQLGAVKWRFNAWAKYPDWKLDDEAGRKMARFTRAHEWRPSTGLGQRLRPLVLEGGSIDVNGQGMLLTTSECLLSDIQNRNPGVERERLEEALAEYLGIKKVLWLGCGIAGDDTHGHVDDITRFVAPDAVVTTVEPDTSDPNHQPLRQNLLTLNNATDQNGGRLRVIELPMPSPVVFRGQRLPASYANFYIANGLVLVPTFNDPNDRRALAILSECFSGRQVVGIHSRDLVWGLGTLHCLTQQQPRPL